MELHFISIYRVHGISTLPDSKSRQVWESNGAKAYLTSDLTEFVEHADRASAVIHGIMTGLFGQELSGTVEERIASRVAEIREERAKKHGNGVFLVFHGTREAEQIVADITRDTETFTVAFDAIDKKAVYNEYLPALLRALAAVVVGLDFEASANVSKVTETSYLIDPSTSNPTYSITVTAGAATVSLAKMPDESAFDIIDRNATALQSDTKVVRVLDQFVQSLSRDFDEFRCFLSAWNALEIFVSSSFKKTYSDQWFTVLRSAAPATAAEYFDRLKEIMSGKHSLTDKFVVIASLLDESGAEADIVQFRSLKARRDEISHGVEDPTKPYPIYEAQQLLRKYLRLHLSAQSSQL